MPKAASLLRVLGPSMGVLLPVYSAAPTPSPQASPASTVSASAFVGARVVFSVVVSGSQPMTYAWAKDFVEQPNSNADTYVIASAQLSDSGSYIAVVQNGGGLAKSNAAVLTVLPLPTLTPAPTAAPTVAPSPTPKPTVPSAHLPSFEYCTSWGGAWYKVGSTARISWKAGYAVSCTIGDAQTNPAAVVVNGANLPATSSLSVTFPRTGLYVFLVTATNSTGQSVTAKCPINVY